MPLIDPSVIGSRQPERVIELERGLLRLFALSIGQTDPIYTDVDAARAAGHPDLPAPPTYLFGLKLAGRTLEQESTWLTEHGIDLRNILHGEQKFEYHATAYAGDALRFTPQVTDLVVKKDGALQFVTRTVQVTRVSDGARIVGMIESVAVREPSLAQIAEGAVR